MYKCNKCNGADTYTKVYHYSIKVKGKTIEFEDNKRYCQNCNSVINDKELSTKANNKAITIYNDLYGIKKDELKSFRREMNLSLDDFAKIIGCAKKTLISYESGKTIPNDTYQIIIKTIMDKPKILKNMINSNKERYDDKSYDKINKRLDVFLSNN